MSKDIDFIKPDIKKIQKPIQSKVLKTQHKKKAKTFQIKKSFIPEQPSQIHEQLRPQVEQLKKFLKLKRQRQKRQKQQSIDGKKTKNQVQNTAVKQKVQQKYKEDEGGHLRDQQGNLIFVKNQTTQLKINQKKQLQLRQKQLSKKQRIKVHEQKSRSLQDRNLALSSSLKKRIIRSKVGLQFLEKGSYQPYSNKQIVKQQASLDMVAQNQTSQSTKLIRRRFKTQLQFSRQVPKCQWWDTQIINKELYDSILQKQQRNQQKINFQQLLLIQTLKNQVVVQNLGQTNKKQQKINIPLYLTKDQRKKLKRKKKKQKLIQKNDMIKLGLIQPQKPRLKVSNMAIVMKNQFIIDPSKVQAEAKRQQQQRLNQHLNNNSERKLNRSQKKQKSIRKLKKDSAKQCRRIVFKLNNLKDPSQIFKVNMNAKQLALNGFILNPAEYHNQPVLVMAQGGQKAIRFFRNLMVNRIKWAQKNDNECKLIWEGAVQSSKLGKWRTIEVNDESETIRALTQRGVQNFRQILS